MKYILRKNRSKPGVVPVKRPGVGLGSLGGVSKPGVNSIALSPSGHYDLANKKLTNVKLPEDKNDGVNLQYVTENCLVKKADLYDANGLRLANLKPPQEKSDAVTLKHLNDNALIYPKNKNYIPLRGKRFTGAGHIPDDEKDTLIHADYMRKHALCLENDRFQARGKPIGNVANPVNGMDVATKQFVEQTVSAMVIPNIPQTNQPLNQGTMKNFLRDISESDKFFENYLEQPMNNHVLFLENDRFQAKGLTIANVGDAVFDTDATNRQTVSNMMTQQCLMVVRNTFQGKGLVIANVGNPVKGTDVANRQFVEQTVENLATKMIVDRAVNKTLIKAENVGVSGLSTNELLVLAETIGEEFLKVSGSIAIMKKDVLFLKVMIYFETSNTRSTDTFTVDVWRLGQQKPADRMYKNIINIALPHQYEVIYIPNLKADQSIGISCTTNTGTRSLPYKMWAVFEKVF